MTNSFSQMPPSAKVWIYASDSKINSKQIEEINSMVEPFIKNWTAHQNQLKAEFALLYNCFLVFMVDEGFNEISGCGIDKSVKLVKEIELKTNLNFFNRLKIQLLNNEEVTYCNKSDIISKIATCEINNDTKTFNNQVITKESFDKEWIIPVENAWFYPKLKTANQ